ncbi:MAG: caspase family protein [Vicingus serpentipes]|nr:caspase family protein [Vicingus serpentipes]
MKKTILLLLLLISVFVQSQNIYVYRNKNFGGSLQKLKVFINELQIGTLSIGEILPYKIAANGVYQLRINTFAISGNKSTTVDARTDKNYYFETGFRTMGGLYLKPITYEELPDDIKPQIITGNNTPITGLPDTKQSTPTETIRVKPQENVAPNNTIPDKEPFSNTGKYYALIIGNNDYHDPAISSLDEPIKDATKLFNVLTTQYTFDVNNVIFLKNASYVKMIEAFDNLSENITPNDNLLVFYAGHGWWDEDKNLGYWLPTDAKKSNTAFWIANSRISDYMSSIHSKHTLLIADACFSGSIFKTRSAFADAQPAINKLYDLPSKKAMTSGNLKEVPDKSVFLQFLVKRLADNTDKYISSDVLFSSFRQAVLNNSPTEPQYGTIQNAGDEGGEFIFIRK